jgi:hypothetical protein
LRACAAALLEIRGGRDDLPGLLARDGKQRANAAGIRPGFQKPRLLPHAPEKFQDASRGKPLPHSLPEVKKREVGLTRETWRMKVVSDPDHSHTIQKPLTKSGGTALDFEAIMRLAKRHSVRFAKVMTCLNLSCRLGRGGLSKARE